MNQLPRLFRSSAIIAVCCLGSSACDSAGAGGSASGTGGKIGSGGTAATATGGSAGTKSGGATGTGGAAGALSATGGRIGTGGAATGGAAGNGSGGSTAPSGPCDPYVWPAYDQKINYDYKNEFPDIDPSKFKILQGCNASVVAGQKSAGWWSFTWAKNRNSKITDAQIDQVLAGLTEDLGYARDVMGWPPDKGPQNGYFSSVYLYGSGLCTDSASNTEEGGWQSSVVGYPMVLISWAPIVNYDRGGITHEAIHAVLASMPSGDKTAWFSRSPPGATTWAACSTAPTSRTSSPSGWRRAATRGSGNRRDATSSKPWPPASAPSSPGTWSPSTEPARPSSTSKNGATPSRAW